MKKSGFSFLELIIGITITSILSLVLFLAYSQTNLASRNLNKIIDIDIKVSIIQNQLERDISGVFAPNVAPIKEEKQKKESDAKNKQEKDKKENTEKTRKAEKAETEKSENEAVQFLEKTFFGENKGRNLNELTFITCNPLQVYGQSKPRIARVTYRLKEDKLSKNSYSLFRQESLELVYGAEKGNVEYEVANGIKEFNIEFIVPESEENSKEKKEVKEKKFKIYNEWRFQGRKITKENPFIIPLFVNIKITFWEDAEHTLEQKFEFKYFIYAFDSQFIKKKKTDELKKIEEMFRGIENLRREAGIKDTTEQETKNKKQQEKK